MMNEWILSSSILICAVLLGRRLLRGRISLRLQYALWAVVLIRLLLPVQLFTSEYGAGTVARDVDITAPVRQVYISANESRYEQAYDAAYRWASSAYEYSGQSADPIVIEQTAREMAQSDMELDLNSLLTQIWLGGMAVMSAVIGLCNFHLSRRLRRHRWEYPAADCLLQVFVTEALPTPCIFGLFRPAIYLTPEAARDEKIRGHVLAHEQTHYRHGDHIWSVLRSVCLVLHWYNPLVWIAVKASKTDAELACDEGVLARLGEGQRGDYGRTLIGLTCAAPMGDYLLTATTMTGSAGSIRQRIRLLMARPKNTVLAVTAVVLIGTIVVGCAFSGAPQATEPDPTVPQESTGSETPIDSDFLKDGILVYPGTEWGMTTEEVLTALNITEYGILSGNYGFLLSDQTFLGQTADIAFLFTRCNEETAWGLSGVEVRLEDEAAASAVWDELHQALGKADFWTNGVACETWYSDARIEDLVSAEAWAEYRKTFDGQELPETARKLLESASSITWLGDSPPNPSNQVLFDGNIAAAMQIEATLVSDPAAEAAALFGENADPWYLAALSVPYQNWYYLDTLRFFTAGQTAVALTDAETALITESYGKEALEKPIFRMTAGRMGQIVETHIGSDLCYMSLSGFLYCQETDAYLAVMEDPAELRHPEIISCEIVADNEVLMRYCFPGEQQRYAATLFKQDTWKVIANQLLIQQPVDARVLTEAEIARVNEAYNSFTYDEELGSDRLSDVSGFFNCIFSDPTQINLEQLLRYYPSFGEADQKEWNLLRKKYGEDLFFYEVADIQEMPTPVHRYEIAFIDQAFRRYTGISYDDLKQKDTLYHLDETQCYYNGTSDANPGKFVCQGGWIQEDSVVLYSYNSILLLTGQDGNYYMQAHLPALVLTPPSSHPMIPAEG